MSNRIPARLGPSISHWLAVAFVMCALVLVPYGHAQAAAGGSPTMDLDPPEAPPGSQARASVVGFDACTPADDVGGTSQVTFVWDGADRMGSAALESGAGSIGFLVPNAAKLGAHHVQAICDTNKSLTAPGTFIVVAPRVQPVTVPDVTGLSVDEASQHLEKAGLVLGHVTGDGDVVETQDPAANGEVPSGSPVDIGVGTASPPVAPRLVRVPDLVGTDVAAAPRVLETRGLALGDVTGDGGVIHTQNPSPQTLVPTGTEVTVSVEATVPPQRLVRVPDLVGKSVEDAKRIVANLDLALGDTAHTDDGTVADQEPAPGTLVPVGSIVSLRVKADRGLPVLPLVLAGIGGAGILAGGYRLIRTRRANTWTRNHVSVASDGMTEDGSAMAPAGDGPSDEVVVRIDRHIDAGAHQLEELPR